MPSQACEIGKTISLTATSYSLSAGKVTVPLIPLTIS